MQILVFLTYIKDRLRSAAGKGALALWAWGLVAQPAWGQVPLNSICWQENQRLKQRDFTARPEAPAAGEAPFLASSYSEVKVQSFTNAAREVVFEVTVRFIKDKSWFDQGQTVGNWTSVVRNPDRLLAHEQLHFDLAELIARRIRKVHAAYQAQKSPQPAAQLRAEMQRALLKAEIRCLLEDRRALDDWYDEQTNHGLLAGPQQQWQQRVAHELAELREYRSKEDDCE